MSQKQIVIGIAGEIGAGKGTVTAYLAEYYSATNLRYSTILQNVLIQLGLEYNRANLATLAEALRTAFGTDILSRALIAQIAQSDANVVVVEGIRKAGELDTLRTMPGFKFMFVDADMRLRYERIHIRGEKADDNTKTWDDFVADHARPADRDVATLRTMADITIDNNHNHAQTRQQIDEWMTNNYSSDVKLNKLNSTGSKIE